LETHDYVLTARRHWLLIIGTAIGLAVIAALGTSLIPAQYVSSSRVFVSANSTDSAQAYQGAMFSAQRVSSYADLVHSSELSQRVIAQLHLHTTPGQLSGQIQATVVPDTVILRIEVNDPSRLQAQRINSAVVTQLQRLIREFETPRGKTISLLKATAVGPPKVTSSPVSPHREVVIAVGFAFGLLLGFGIAILLDLMKLGASRADRSNDTDQDHAPATT
jgi:capsular polysaccharide biosynthesis protein